MAATSIVDHEVGEATHDVFTVTFKDTRIETLVTHTPHVVDSWIAATEESSLPRGPGRLLVGIDVEWRPNKSTHDDNPIATIQLCVARRCLIFQPIYAPHIPPSLAVFLANPDHTFVGVGIDEDAEKLLGDYNLKVSNAVDLRSMAAEQLRNPSLRKAGLKSLAMAVLHESVEKPKRVTMSRWDQEWLNYDQVQYACLDAFLSSEIGRFLNASSSG